MYGMTELSSTGPSTIIPQQQAPLNTIPSATSQKPEHYSGLNELNNIEDIYHIIASDDDKMDDAVYSVPHADNISKKDSKRHWTKYNETEIQAQETGVTVGPDQQQSGPVYHVLEHEKYKMFSTNT